MARSIHNYPFILLFFIVACCSFPFLASGQDAKVMQRIHLRRADITPIPNARQWMDSMAHVTNKNEPVQVLVQFTAIPSAKEIEILQANGIALYDYVPDNTFNAVITFPVNMENIASLPLHSIVCMKPEWKADESIWKLINRKSGSVEVMVSFYGNIDVGAVKQFVSGIGGQIHTSPFERYGCYKVIVAAAKVPAIAEWYGVRSISPVTDMVPLDLQSMPAVKGNIARAAQIYGGYNLLGDSVTVGVGDQSSGIYHIDIKDRITNFNPAANHHHGEFVNGVVGNASIVDPLAAVITPRVSLVDHLFDLILPSTGAMLLDFNMTITNNSYEVVASDCDYAGTYDVYSRFLDTLAIQYPDVLHVFASGNDGWITCGPYPKGFGTVGGGYQPAKNTVVVGSITDLYDQADDESRGPLRDGRLKPDITAIGLGTYSTIDVDQYTWAAGTSMAAPQVASGLAALTQRYRQLNGGQQPRADVLKAILLNGAMDLGNPGPDFSYGFGAMDLYRSLEILNKGHFYSSSIFNNGIQSASITIPPNTAQVKIMLYWHDIPASTSSAKQLINDLDLVVTDPSSAQHLPLVLDATPANVNNNASEHPDHVNNAEQVVITNPASGSYSLNVRGFDVPQGPQQYVLAYDIIPNGLHLTFPIGGEQLSNFDQIRVYWDAVSDGHTFTVEFSPDNGASWVPISNSVAADAHHCDFMPTGYNSGLCRVRVSRNGTGEVVTSAPFAISAQPIAALEAAQCPGYLNIHWSPVPNATSYLMHEKVGFYMQVVDTVMGDTTYSFANMSLTEKSYVAVQPIINGAPAYRSIAVIAVANYGSCTNPVSTGDLLVEKILSPSSGRMNTSSQLSTTALMVVRLRNLYTVPCANYTLSYRINSGPWVSVTGPAVIPANSSADISVFNLPLGDTGVYHLAVSVHNQDLADPQSGNDTFAITVRNLPNDTLNLATPYTDGFEDMPRFGVTHDSVGVSPNGHWDYFNADDYGRIRSFVDDNVTISGNRSVSLDEDRNVLNGSHNTFVGTFNLINYDTATTEIRFDFDYVLHGTPKTTEGNLVAARSSDADSWMPVFNYDPGAYPGTVTHARSISLTDAVRHIGHNFSTATQISFGQSDTSLVASADYGNGMSFDNFRLYTVANDAGVLGVVSPLANNCGLPSATPLVVRVNNGVNYTLHNVQLQYYVDGGPLFTGVIDSIKAKDTIDYAFAQPLDIAPGSTHTLSVWLSSPGDSYQLNDSILNYTFRNSVVISSYPYLENFETGDGGYFSTGIKNSWQYGTPAAQKINKAASGTKAWKTNLTGKYNNLERSYLYSPCFDISQLQRPMLSFSVALDIENCGGTLCDAAYVEYSFDGLTWTKLGASQQGTNWYDPTFDIWNTSGATRWHVASIPLPQPPSGETIHFRFVMTADPGVTFEGVAVDDIHIYDLVYSIMPTSGVTLTQNVSGNSWTDQILNNYLLSSVQPDGQEINELSTMLYPHDTIYNTYATQYTFSRSYTIKATNSANDSVGLRLYLLDSEVINVLNDLTCPACSPVRDAYSLGITQFDNNSNRAAENGSLADDTGGVFTYYPYTSVKWVPYDKGYYAEFRSKPFSEYWFNDGGPTASFPADAEYLSFIAFRNGDHATVYWNSFIDTSVSNYVLQRSGDSLNFTDVLDTAATHQNNAQYTYNDGVTITADTNLYYRLQWTMTGGNAKYTSAIRKVGYSDTAANLVSFNAQMIGSGTAQVNWTSYLDGMADHYLLERAVDNGSFTAINNTVALKKYGQHYTFMDKPSFSIPFGAPVHYRLTAVLQNGASIVLPVRTVKWDNGNSVVNVFPNPTYDGNISIQWHADAGTLMHINIFDALGRSTYEASFTSTQWANTSVFRALAMTKGIYFVKIDIGGQRYTAKLVYD